MNSGEWAILVVATVPTATLVFGRFARRRLIARRVAAELASPDLGGVPLPSVDDPRWQMVKGQAEFGGFVVLEAGAILFEDERLGSWRAYANAVHAALRATEREALARRAWQAIAGETGGRMCDLETIPVVPGNASPGFSELTARNH